MIAPRYTFLLLLFVAASSVYGFVPATGPSIRVYATPSTELGAFFTKEKKGKASAPAAPVKKSGPKNPFAKKNAATPVPVATRAVGSASKAPKQTTFAKNPPKNVGRVNALFAKKQATPKAAGTAPKKQTFAKSPPKKIGGIFGKKIGSSNAVASVSSQPVQKVASKAPKQPMFAKTSKKKTIGTKELFQSKPPTTATVERARDVKKEVEKRQKSDELKKQSARQLTAKVKKARTIRVAKERFAEKKRVTKVIAKKARPFKPGKKVGNVTIYDRACHIN